MRETMDAMPTPLAGIDRVLGTCAQIGVAIERHTVA